MQMKHNMSLKRLKYVFSVLMAIASVICFCILPLSNTAGASKEVKQMAAEEKIRDEESAALKQTVMGDIYDRNGNVLVTVSGKDKPAEYRNDSAYSVTIGFNEDEIGAHLLLKSFEKDLFCTDGGLNKGRSLTLTLDAELQEYAYDLINRGDGERGSVTVIDVKTGEVLAMAFNPSFSIKQMRLLCEEDGYQTSWKTLVFGENEKLAEALSTPLTAPTRPGSIYKLVTSIGILENGLENVIIDDNNQGVYEENGIKIRNSGDTAYGALDYLGGFAHSSNIYFGRMTYEYLGWKKFREISERCLVGIYQKYDFGDVQSTFDSRLEPYDETKPNDTLAKAGFGYASLQLTGVHAAMITQGIANGGIMYSPYMVQKVNKTTGYRTGEDIYQYQMGEETESKSYSSTQHKEYVITDTKTANQIREAMKAAYKNVELSSGADETSEEGLIVNGKLYPIALKTGTADLDEEGNNNLWMVSFAPADNPRYVVAVNRYKVQGKYGADLFQDTISMYKALFQNE